VVEKPWEADPWHFGLLICLFSGSSFTRLAVFHWQSLISARFLVVDSVRLFFSICDLYTCGDSAAIWV